jgi:hypothetical protein
MIARLGLTAIQLFDGPELEAGLALHKDGQTWRQLASQPENAASRERERLRRIKKPPEAATPLRSSLPRSSKTG